MQAVERPGAEGRARSQLRASPGSPSLLGESGEAHPATLFFVLEKTQQSRRELPERAGSWWPATIASVGLYSCPVGSR